MLNTAPRVIGSLPVCVYPSYRGPPNRLEGVEIRGAEFVHALGVVAIRLLDSERGEGNRENAELIKADPAAGGSLRYKLYGAFSA